MHAGTLMQYCLAGWDIQGQEVVDPFYAGSWYECGLSCFKQPSCAYYLWLTTQSSDGVQHVCVLKTAPFNSEGKGTTQLDTQVDHACFLIRVE